MHHQQRLTLRQILVAAQQLNPKLLDAPVFLVTKVREVERGEHEGALSVTSKSALSMIITQSQTNGAVGLYLFSAEEGDTHEIFMSTAPPGFTTGNPEIDKRFRQGRPEDEGEDWKNG